MTHSIATRLLAASVSSLVVACALVGCAESSSTTKSLTTSDIGEIASNNACSNPHLMGGDPDYWGSAAGLYCLPESGTGVVLRIYDEPDATLKLIDDWSALITEDNQLVYGDYWFATGPATTLETLFGEFNPRGPQTFAPAGTKPTSAEANLALCSSISYGVTTQYLHTGDTVDLQQYYASYPGLHDLVSSVASKATRDGAEAAIQDDLLLTAALTKYDSDIKSFCAESFGAKRNTASTAHNP